MYQYEEFNTEGCFKTLGVIVAFFAAMFFCGLTAEETWVTDEEASAYIQDMTGANRVEIINDDGNDNPLLHTMSDVTFDVWLYFENEPRRRAQFRCTNGYGYDLICRGYSAGEDE